MSELLTIYQLKLKKWNLFKEFSYFGIIYTERWHDHEMEKDSRLNVTYLNWYWGRKYGTQSFIDLAQKVEQLFKK